MKPEDIEVPFKELAKDPNFILIVIGAVVWFVSPYIPLIGPLFFTAGFVITCLATAASALKRPATMTWPGLILGAIIHLIGQYLSFIPVLGNALIVLGAVLILFSVVPLALQYGNAPLMESLPNLLGRNKKEQKKEAESTPSEETDEPASVDE
ncbi:MAG: hypothetical protein ACFFAY_01705 [Promethearchaeota archaeon]